MSHIEPPEKNRPTSWLTSRIRAFGDEIFSLGVCSALFAFACIPASLVLRFLGEGWLPLKSCAGVIAGGTIVSLIGAGIVRAAKGSRDEQG